MENNNLFWYEYRNGKFKKKVRNCFLGLVLPVVGVGIFVLESSLWPTQWGACIAFMSFVGLVILGFRIKSLHWKEDNGKEI